MLALRIFIVLILLSVAMPPVLWGHEGVHVDIDRITAEIAKSSAPGSLYLLRARLCRLPLASSSSAASFICPISGSWRCIEKRVDGRFLPAR